MRVLITAFGSHGDILPLIAIGGELARRGHEVVMAGAEPFAGAAARAGIGFEPLMSAAEYDEAVGQADLWRPLLGLKRLFAFAERSIRPAYDFIARRADASDTMLIASTLAVGARLAQDALRLPLVTVHLSPLTMQSRHEAPRLPAVTALNWLPPALKWQIHLGADEWFVDPQLTPGLNRLRAELGLAPVKRLRHWWNAPRRVLLMCPEWFVAPQPDWPQQVRQLGFPRVDHLGAPSDGVDAALERFLGQGDPPVAVTFGTAMRQGASLYRAAIEGAAKAGRRCLVMTADPVEVPPALRERTFFTAYAPFGEVLPRCAALVHHGGIGTVARAFAAGVPQLVTPLAFDQFDNADRVRRLGCGLAMHRRLFGPSRAARALERLIQSPEVARSCLRVAALSAGRDATQAAAAEIEAEYAAVLARRSRRTGTATSG